MSYLNISQTEYIELSNLQFPSRCMGSIEIYWVLGQWSQEVLGFPSSMTYISGLTFCGGYLVQLQFIGDPLKRISRDEGFFVSIKTLNM